MWFPDALPPSTRERPPGCRTIFVGGLPENIKEEILREIFESCGNICSIRVSKKNFAHIRFDFEDSVDKALYISGELITSGLTSWLYHPGGHYWNYYPGALSLSQVTATHLKIGHP